MYAVTHMCMYLHIYGGSQAGQRDNGCMLNSYESAAFMGYAGV